MILWIVISPRTKMLFFIMTITMTTPSMMTLEIVEVDDFMMKTE
jgi:hypothetical protein